jgi:hypothetical protein
MAGGLMQLVAVGAQDVYLTGNPQTTFFRTAHRRHTNFSMESIPHVFDGTVGLGRVFSATVSRRGDLVHGAALDIQLPTFAHEARKSPLFNKEVDGLTSVQDEVRGGADIDADMEDRLLAACSLLLDRMEAMLVEWRSVLSVSQRGAVSMQVTQYMVFLLSGGAGGSPPAAVTLAPYDDGWLVFILDMEVAMTEAGLALAMGAWLEAAQSTERAYEAYVLALVARPLVWSWVPDIGRALVEWAEVEIGGQVIDRHYGEWLHIWRELTTTGSERRARIAADPINGVVHVPLRFWFCGSMGVALPLIALQYHEVKLRFKLRDASELIRQAAVPGDFVLPRLVDDADVTLNVDYVHLDTNERRRFAQTAHEYLIHQVQRVLPEGVAPGARALTVSLPLNHPCTEFVWTVRADGAHVHDFATADGRNPVQSARLLLNGHDRWGERDGLYFDTVQPYQCHSRTPAVRGINVYSFALRPESHQPSGTCNMSRVDSAALHLKLMPPSRGATFTLYGVNRNVLRVQGGMAGTAFAT